MLLRSATNLLKREGVHPLSLNALTMDISGINVDRVSREAVENILIQAARFSSGIWSMHYEQLAAKIRTFESPKAEAGMVSAPLGYEPDPSKSVDSISSDYAEVAVASLNEHSNAWRDGLLKGRLWRSSTDHLLDRIYLPRFELLRTQADRMTRGAISVYAEALCDNLDVITAFGLKDRRGRPNKNFLKLAEPISLIYGIHLFNKSLERLYKEVFRGSSAHAAPALMVDDVVEPQLKEWAFAHRWKGFFAPQFHGELALRMLGSSEETFLRLERAGEVDDCMIVLDYLLNEVKPSETDYIAQHARYTAIADVADRTAEITTDTSIRTTLNEWRDEALREREELEDYLSPFPMSDRSKRRMHCVVEHISSAKGWKGPSDHDDDPTPAA